MHLSDILDIEHVRLYEEAGSKKRTLELVSHLLTNQTNDVSADDVFAALTSRERLGSTAIGSGVAIPHARLPGLTHPQGCLVTLKTPIDFDAMDHQLVDILFGLIVPDTATEEHLQLLAGLAEFFNSQEMLALLRSTQSTADLFPSILEYGAA